MSKQLDESADMGVLETPAEESQDPADVDICTEYSATVAETSPFTVFDESDESDYSSWDWYEGEDGVLVKWDGVCQVNPGAALDFDLWRSFEDEVCAKYLRPNGSVTDKPPCLEDPGRVLSKGAAVQQNTVVSEGQEPTPLAKEARFALKDTGNEDQCGAGDAQDAKASNVTKEDLGAVFQYGESSNPVGHASLSEPIPGSCPTCAWFDAGPVKVGRQ
ncbi:unnamed protein product [Durusdinium trenchii]|uniref:Uncharacterized protein n=1 Tax=Durusdinium trenchii TaxID=1381693 RepID=A0ABP0KZX0_9DINO